MSIEFLRYFVCQEKSNWTQLCARWRGDSTALLTFLLFGVLRKKIGRWRVPLDMSGRCLIFVVFCLAYFEFIFLHHWFWPRVDVVSLIFLCTQSFTINDKPVPSVHFPQGYIIWLRKGLGVASASMFIVGKFLALDLNSSSGNTKIVGVSYIRFGHLKTSWYLIKQARNKYW